MVRPDFEKWKESAGEMLRLAVETKTERERERYLALYKVGSQEANASQWAKIIGRSDETVLAWIHRYNAEGRAGVAYRHSGGVRKRLSQSEQEQIVEVVLTSQPVAHELPGHGWNLKKLCRWVETKLQRKVSRNTVRTILKQFGLSWKKCKKLLTRANAEKRTAFVAQFQALYERMCRHEVTIVYIDEAHIHQDLDLGYTWSPIGESTWVASTSPGLSARINWFGAYNFTAGQCFLWQDGKCNSDTTLAFLEQLAQWLATVAGKVVIIWDNVSYHKEQRVKETVAQLGFELLPLPTYSPDLNPIEGLWKWLREDVTQLFCHPTLQALFLDCIRFIDTLNLTPEQVIKRLWPRFDLDPDVEKLRISS